MKNTGRLLSILLTAVVLSGAAAPAFADRVIDEDLYEGIAVSGEAAVDHGEHSVSATAENGTATAVLCENGGSLILGGNAAAASKGENEDTGVHAYGVMAESGSSALINGSVSADAVNNAYGVLVEGGSEAAVNNGVTASSENGSAYGVMADVFGDDVSAAAITGDVKATVSEAGNAYGVQASTFNWYYGEGSSLVEVTGNVAADAAGDAFGVEVVYDSEAAVTGNVSVMADENAYGVVAEYDSTAGVGGGVTAEAENGSAYGVYADNGSTVAVEGSVKAGSASQGCGSVQSAEGVHCEEGGTVTVAGNVTAAAEGDAAACGISAVSGSMVAVGGSVTASSNGDAVAVYAEGSTVRISGDVAQNGGGNVRDAIKSEDSTVIVEGRVTGTVDAADSYVIVGRLDGDDGTAVSGFLVGLSEDSQKITQLFSIDMNSFKGVLPSDETASGKEYYVVKTVAPDPDEPGRTETVVLTLRDGRSKSIATASGFDGIEISPDRKSVNLTYSNAGGMNNLVLSLADIPPEVVEDFINEFCVPSGRKTGPSAEAGIVFDENHEEGNDGTLKVKAEATQTVIGLFESRPGIFRVTVDGEAVDPDCCALAVSADGAVVIEFSAEYLSTLSPGVHRCALNCGWLVFPFKISV